MEIAVLIPCYNEELTVEKVVKDFRHSLPQSTIYVYDNNSTDRTYELAKKAGAIVRKENRQGKGNVVRSMFRDIEADVYILVDGDDTYPAEEAQKMIEYVTTKEADMVIGDRLSNGTYSEENKRNFHDFGNKLILNLINWLYKSNLNDILTGYRVFNRYFVKNFPILSEGFQIETEMSVFALNYKFKIKQVPITYRDRPEGSFSKLNTFKDGYRVIRILSSLFKDTKPMLFFGIVSLISFGFTLLVGLPVIVEFLDTRYITHVPLAILASGLGILSVLFLLVALILDTMAYNHRLDFEHRLNHYLHQENLFNKEY